MKINNNALHHIFVLAGIVILTLSFSESFAEQIQISSDKTQYYWGEKITISWNSIDASSTKYIISVYDPQGRQIISTQTDQTSASFLASGSLWQKTGQYRATIFAYGGYDGQTSFSVLEKQKLQTQKSQILEVSILSDKAIYKKGDLISISGQIKTTKNLRYDATISLINPKGKTVAADQVTPRFDGSDELVAKVLGSFFADGTVWSGPGKYNATLSYGPKKISTSFDVLDSDKYDKTEKIKKVKELAKKKLKEKQKIKSSLTK